MKFTVGKISGQSGLAAQTIRAYADRGMLRSDKRDDSAYRYFDADAVNQASAIRRLRMMGFGLDAVEEIMTCASQTRYEEMLGALIAEKRQTLQYEQDVLDYLAAYEKRLTRRAAHINEGEIIHQNPFYCLDYRKNGDLLCQGDSKQALLNEWMAQAVFLRNYSPYPEALLEGGTADHVIGLIIEERYARYVRVAPPVYKKKGCLCAVFDICHDDRMNLLPDGPGFVLRYLRENGLRLAGEPFFIGDVPVFEAGEKRFYGRLYVPAEATAQ